MGLVTAAIGGLVAKGIGAIGANQQKQKAKGKVNTAEKQLAELEANRQKIVNPYEGYKNLSGLAEDVSGMAKNAYAQLGVATQAAEFQAEEADLALANALDTIRATGASAGGATALAQAALQSKKGISASLEMQEAQNEKLRAQGEQRVNDMQMKEALRIQGIEMSEAQRMQQAEAMGKDYVYQEQEAREEVALDRAQAKVEGASANLQAAQQSQSSALSGLATSAVGAVGTVGGAIKSDKKDWWKNNK
jgi:chromosome segregation ATPase